MLLSAYESLDNCEMHDFQDSSCAEAFENIVSQLPIRILHNCLPAYSVLLPQILTIPINPCQFIHENFHE